MDNKDKYTENHSYRVSIYATKIASYLRLSPQTIEDIRDASLLHDIGKLSVDTDILTKPGSLDPEERAVIEHAGEVYPGLHVADGVLGDLDALGHALVALAADTGRPGNGLVVTDLLRPGLADLAQVVGENPGRAGPGGRTERDGRARDHVRVLRSDGWTAQVRGLGDGR